MKKMVKMLALGLLGGMSLVTTQAGAGCGDCCWDPCDMDGCFEVGGEALYWKPTGADFQYAQVSAGAAENFIINTKCVVGDYDWGFRVFGSYYSSDCCNFLTLDYTYLRTTDADSCQAADGVDDIAIVFASTQLQNKAAAHIKFDYDKVNLRFGRFICCGCDSRLYAYAGGRYVNIEERRNIRANVAMGTVSTYHEKSCFQGGGMEVGFGGHYDLFCDISLVANAGLTAQVGEVKNNWDAFEIEANEQVRTIKSRTICVPGSELRLGLSYTYKCDCWWITGDIGYQMDYYWRALSLRDSDVNGFLRSDRTSVGFAGLYFGLRARF